MCSRVSEFQQRSVDEDLMALALAENRIPLTGDKDFGWLVFARRMDSPGVILMRFPCLRAEFARRVALETGKRTCVATGEGLRDPGTWLCQN